MTLVSGRYLLVAFTFFRFFALFGKLLGAFLVVEKDVFAGKPFSGADIGVLHVLAEVSKHFRAESHIKVVDDALLPGSFYNLSGQTPDGAVPGHDEISDFIGSGD